VAGAEYRSEPDWRMVAPMTIATGMAAIFINSSWVQILAQAIQIGGWIWYFAALQTALSG